jgi:hypothetical protein
MVDTKQMIHDKMKLILVFTSILIFLIGCDEPENSHCIIDKIIYVNPDGSDWGGFESYDYNVDGTIKKITFPEGLDTQYEIFYDNGKINKVNNKAQFFTFENLYSFIGSDSLMVVSKNLTAFNEPNDTSWYKSDEEGQIIQMSDSDGSNKIFTWHDGNVINVYDVVLDIKSSYTYDNKVNPFKDFSLVFLSPFRWSKNNVIKITNNVDPLYHESFEYEYNGNYPSKIQTLIFSNGSTVAYGNIVYSNCVNNPLSHGFISTLKQTTLNVLWFSFFLRYWLNCYWF